MHSHASVLLSQDLCFHLSDDRISLDSNADTFYLATVLHYRSIIEKGYSHLVADRKSEDPTPEDKALLKEFHTAKDNSWKQERSEGQTQLQRQRDARAIVTLCVLVLLLMFAVIVVSC